MKAHASAGVGKIVVQPMISGESFPANSIDMPEKTADRLLKDIHLKLKKGEYCCILGPSGSGKSSLLNILGCLDLPSSGEVFLKNQNLSKRNESELALLRACKIGFIFQNFNLNPVLDPIGNVAIVSRILGVKKKQAARRAREYLEKVGLGERLFHNVNDLSGGERQRVAIARALVKKPDLVLADEPTGNLDLKTGKTIIDILKRSSSEQNTTIVQVTHNHALTRRCDSIYEIRDGECFASD